MKCPSCGYEEKYDAKVCSFCSALLQPDEEEADENHGKGPGLSPRSVEKMKKEEEAKQLEFALAGEVLAEEVAADIFLILTNVNIAKLDHGKPTERTVKKMTTFRLRSTSKASSRQGAFGPSWGRVSSSCKISGKQPSSPLWRWPSMR